MKANNIMGLLVVLLLTITALTANAQRVEDFPDIGDPITTYPQVEWIKGGPISKFEDGKIYLVELWATWCVPCMAAMPHLNELSLKFKDKITFIAQDVFERDEAKAVSYVKNHTNELNFNIALSGPPGSDFDKKWIKPAAVSAIPQTYLIQNGKLMWVTTPDQINEQVLQLLVDGKFTMDAAKKLSKSGSGN
ncbi:TlpA disulfide reductase family protein [Mucilaginibacter oryzae]|nr:TlpA disulfide reductase family protein [Mucilaginibacter oryzae]